MQLALLEDLAVAVEQVQLVLMVLQELLVQVVLV
jgi:hypothetical protein